MGVRFAGKSIVASHDIAEEVRHLVSCQQTIQRCTSAMRDDILRDVALLKGFTKRDHSWKWLLAFWSNRAVALTETSLQHLIGDAMLASKRAHAVFHGYAR